MVLSAIQQWLNDIKPDSIVVAYSGGVDSQVLLHALVALRATYSFRLKAIHVDHGLHAQSSKWAAFCQQTALAWHVEFKVSQLALSTEGNVEERARNARYAAFASHVVADDWLVTAHHQQDQVETCLINLFRGSGVKGLSGMPMQRSLAEGMVGRPLLKVSQEAILAYADQHQLAWVDDPSNAESLFRRNFLRNEILPLLREKWGDGIDAAIARSSKLCGEAESIIATWAAAQLSEILAGGSLDLVKLATFARHEQSQLIHFWLADQKLAGFSSLVTDELLRQMLTADEDRQPAICCGDISLRRYRKRLYIVHATKYDPAWLTELQVGRQVKLPDQRCYQLIAEGQGAQSIKHDVDVKYTVRFRQPGAKIRLHGGTQEIKKLLQAAGIPPWERESVPMLYADNELIAAGDRWVAKDWMAEKDTPYFTIQITSS